jgi:hypothetical protein
MMRQKCDTQTDVARLKNSKAPQWPKAVAKIASRLADQEELVGQQRCRVRIGILSDMFGTDKNEDVLSSRLLLEALVGGLFLVQRIPKFSSPPTVPSAVADPHWHSKLPNPLCSDHVPVGWPLD